MIALSYVRAHGDQLGVEAAFDDPHFHVHVPAGAIPKDGPSAGITMATALASLLTERPVKHTVGMTGEVTPAGPRAPDRRPQAEGPGRACGGLTDVILPERNRPRPRRRSEDVREEMSFHPVMSLGEVLELALEPASSTHDVALS